MAIEAVSREEDNAKMSAIVTSPSSREEDKYVIGASGV